jgi:phage terminase small subunit
VNIEISEKHKAFCRALLKNGFNQTKAYQSVYGGNSETAKAKACLLFTKDNVKAYLKYLTDKDENEVLVTKDEVINGIKSAIAKADENKQISAAMKGYELLGKYLAMFTDKSEVKNTGSVVIVTPELKDMMESNE